MDWYNIRRWHGDNLRFHLIPDRDLSISSINGSDIIKDMLHACLSQSKRGIHPIGVIFSDIDGELFSNLKSAIEQVNDVSYKINLQPPAYPSGWNGVQRDVTTFIGKTASIIRHEPCSLKNVQKCLPFFNFDICIKLALSRLWGRKTSTGRPDVTAACSFLSNFSKADVSTISTFSVSLPPLVGHRDYIRVLIPSSTDFFVDQETGIIIGPSKRGKGSQASRDINAWLPRIGSKCSQTITYVVIPNGLKSFDHADVSERTNTGIYMACCIHVEQSSSGNNQDSLFHHIFEYVSPGARYPELKKFFIPFFSAIILPASVAVRFFSHFEIDVTVLAYVHSVEVSSLKIHPFVDGNSNIASNNLEELPRPPDFSFPHGAHIISSANRYFSGDIFKKKTNIFGSEDSVIIGTIPTIKGIDSPILRREVALDKKCCHRSSPLSLAALGTTFYISKPDDSLPNEITTHSLPLYKTVDCFWTISDLPLQMVFQRLREIDDGDAGPVSPKESLPLFLRFHTSLLD